jgi:hypothetical protein
MLHGDHLHNALQTQQSGRAITTPLTTCHARAPITSLSWQRTGLQPAAATAATAATGVDATAAAVTAVTCVEDAALAIAYPGRLLIGERGGQVCVNGCVNGFDNGFDNGFVLYLSTTFKSILKHSMLSVCMACPSQLCYRCYSAVTHIISFCICWYVQVEDKSPFELAPLSVAATGHAAYACGGFLLHGALHGKCITCINCCAQ